MLTATQHRTYQFIKDFIARHQYSPTTGEIAQGIKIQSRGVVYRYLQALAKEGLIKLLPNRRRNICLLEAISNTLPLIGKIAAGQPIEAISQQETLDIADIFLGTGRFALRVSGDSMIDEGILDGDIVVCQRQDSARDGQIIIALVDNESATLKRLRRNANHTVTLLPANSQHKPQTYAAERIKVQGIYIGLLRLSS